MQFDLTHPVKFNGSSEPESYLTLGVVTYKVARAGDSEKTPEAKARAIICAWTTLTPDELDRISFKDFLRLQDVYYVESGLKEQADKVAEEARKAVEEAAPKD